MVEELEDQLEELEDQLEEQLEELEDQLEEQLEELEGLGSLLAPPGEVPEVLPRSLRTLRPQILRTA